MKKIRMLFSLFAFLMILLTIFYEISALIPKHLMKNSNEIILLDENENELLKVRYQYEDEYLPLSKINEDIIACFIVSEDEDFYNHSGVSLKGIIRALISNTFKGTKMGGSTITQQLARTLFLNNEKTILRKIKEMFLAINLEVNYEKNEILEQYLNNIYLGHNLYGINIASSYYFNKDNNKLTLDQAAMLAGIANAPNINAPDINYENAISRRNHILSLLYKNKYIDTIEYETLIKKDTIVNIKEKKLNSIFNPIYYYTINKLREEKLYKKEYFARGIKVYTHIDREIQQKVVDTATLYNPQDGSQIAICIMKPNTNNVLALLGSYNLNDEFNRVTMAKRPIGSTVKPLIYYLALRCELSPLSQFVSEKTTFHINGYGTYSPENATKTYANKKINMIEAIGLSDNIYATKTLLFVGMHNLTRLYKCFNIDTNCVPSSALGVDLLSLSELTSIYNCFASLGTYYEPEVIYKITDAFNNVLYKSNSKIKTVLEKKETLILNQMLTAPFDNNLMDYVAPTLLNYPTKVQFAAKTGSTSSDAYAIGFNPEYTISVWSGNDNNEELLYQFLAKKIFQSIANNIATNNVWFDKTYDINEKKINPITGKNDQNGSIYWF